MGVAGLFVVMMIEPAGAVEPPGGEGAPAAPPNEEPAGAPEAPSSEPTAPAVPEMVSVAAEAVTLTWEAPSQCPGIEDVRRSLAGYLGEGPSRDAGASVEAVAEVTEEAGEFRLSLRTRTGSGVTTKETTARDCRVLADATALIVAVAVDPSTVLGRMDVDAETVKPQAAADGEAPSEPVPDTEASEPEPELEVPGVIEPRPRAEPEPEPTLRFGMRVGGGVDVGVLPGPAGGLRLAGAVFGGRWRAELRGDYWFARTAIAQEGIGARVAAWSAGARGCGVPAIDRERIALEFPLCAGAEAGALRGDPVGDRVSAPDTSRQLWVAADASAGLVWAPRRFIALFVQAELVVPIVRSGFRVGSVEIHRAGPAAGRGLVGLEARFP